MTNTFGKQPLDPIAQLVAKYQSNGQQPPVVLHPRKRDWLGFSDKTLWDWLNLIGILLVPLMIGMFATITAVQQSQIAYQQQHEQQEETTLRTFINDITDLINKDKLNEVPDNSAVVAIAQGKTDAALEALDPDRRIILINFLRDARLCGDPGMIGNYGILNCYGTGSYDRYP